MGAMSMYAPIVPLSTALSIAWTSPVHPGQAQTRLLTSGCSAGVLTGGFGAGTTSIQNGTSL